MVDGIRYLIRTDDLVSCGIQAHCHRVGRVSEMGGQVWDQLSKCCCMGLTALVVKN